ncbi:MAG: hypothetical protein HYX87_06440 [Chloroflexi bacterium]|nr:hypothetical protein [Chloroflexota bacterium]
MKATVERINGPAEETVDISSKALAKAHLDTTTIFTALWVTLISVVLVGAFVMLFR